MGEVRDYDTEEVIEDAKVFIEDVLSVKTDQNGRFRVDNLPSGTYVWKVSAENYCCAEYLNYSVDSEDGVTIFTFYISQDFELNRDRLVILSESLKHLHYPPIQWIKVISEWQREQQGCQVFQRLAME